MIYVLIIMLIVIGAVAGFYFYEFEKSQEKIRDLEKQLRELKFLKNRTKDIMKNDQIDEVIDEIETLLKAYKIGANPFTTLTKLCNTIEEFKENKKKLAEIEIENN